MLWTFDQSLDLFRGQVVNETFPSGLLLYPEGSADGYPRLPLANAVNCQRIWHKCGPLGKGEFRQLGSPKGRCCLPYDKRMESG